jgi:hypothetical protein
MTEAGMATPGSYTAPSRRSRIRGPAKWSVGFFLAINIALLLLILSFANLTEEGPANRALGHSLAILFEIDTYLDDHYEAAQLQAFEQPNDPVVMPDLPIEVSFTAEEVQQLERQEFRAELLQRAARVVYDDGVSVMREGRESDVDVLSTAGVLQYGMDFIRPRPHSVLLVMTIVLAVTAIVLAVALVASGRGYGRLLALGIAVAAGALPFLLFAVMVRFAFRVAADGAEDYFTSEYLQLAEELTWAAIRNGLIFAVGAGVFVVAGAALSVWSDRRALSARSNFAPVD